MRELDRIPGVSVLPVDHLAEGDGPTEVSATAGRATVEFSRALSEAEIDLVFVLGDRTEMLGAALAATIHKVPIAHLHGGDLTQGAYDDSCRHAITKLSHLHFPALPQHAERIRAMGEESWRIHLAGAPALDALRNFEPEPQDELQSELGLDLTRPFAILAFHPETLSETPPREQIAEVLAALRSLEDNLLVIGPNADVGHLEIASALREFVSSRPGDVMVPSLPQRRFWSCMSKARLLVGNSSAGILEAASFGLPVVDIGDRQCGRLRPANVINAPANRAEISSALESALRPDFKMALAGLVNPYGDGQAAGRIVAALIGLPERERVLRKQWPGS